MATTMRCEFLGSTLKAADAPKAAVSQRAQVVQAIKTGTKKVAKAVKKVSGGKSTRGWLGGEGGAQDLDKWYGEC